MPPRTIRYTTVSGQSVERVARKAVCAVSQNAAVAFTLPYGSSGKQSKKID
jgi:nicotinamide mononucleotide (NMN) deamidase PncC